MNVSSFYHVFFLGIMPWLFESVAIILKSPCPVFGTPRGASGEWRSCKEDSSVLTCWLICNWLLIQHSEACCFLPSWRRFSLKEKPNILKNTGPAHAASAVLWLPLAPVVQASACSGCSFLSFSCGSSCFLRSWLLQNLSWSESTVVQPDWLI